MPDFFIIFMLILLRGTRGSRLLG